MNRFIRIVVIKVVIAIIGLSLVNSLNAQSMSASELEQMARGQGYSDAQIELAKQKYGSSSSGQQSKPQNAGSKVQRFNDNENTQRFGDEDNEDSLYLQQNSIRKNNDRVYVDTTSLIRDSSTDTSSHLNYFGYDVFKNIPDAFRPNAIGPVDPGYLVGPGDILRLTVWGQAEFQYELTVNKEGKVFIPVAGQVSVSGVPFDELSEKIKSLLSRNYSGLTGNPQRTFMDLTVAKQRPVRVFIMGEVKQPGGYTVSSFATAFNALYSIGGPLDKGSLRNIKVLRNGKDIATIDIYAYLLGGKCTTDVRLQNNDVVFVPPRGKTVAVTGSVFREAYYELKENDQLSSLLNYCGGVSSLTNLDRAQLFRILPFDKREGEARLARMTDIDLKNYIVQKKEFSLYDKDSISFTPLYADMKNMVKLNGAVRYPGLYESDTVTLSHLIFKLGRVIEEKYFSLRADLFRLNSDLVTKRVIPIDLERLRTDPSYDQRLQAGDEVMVYDKTVEKEMDLQIKIEGEVNRPGLCTLSTNLTVIDALIYAGGFNRKAYKKSVDVYRIEKNNSDMLCKVFKVELPDSFSYLDERIRNFTLEDRDRIVVRIDPAYNEIEIVKVTGKVKFQGAYALVNRSVRLVEVIDRAGGLMPEAFLEGAFVYRGGKRVVVNFEKAYYQKKEKENVLLQAGDSIYIPSKPNTVSVYGNVNNPGLLCFVKDDKVGAYLNRAGGLADSSLSVLVTFPNGETRKIGRYSGGLKVLDGSSIYVTKKPYVDESMKKQGPTIAEVIRDTLAIVTSAVTVIVLVLGMN
jgi:polysaccharide export outer membrane protein